MVPEDWAIQEVWEVQEVLEVQEFWDESKVWEVLEVCEVWEVYWMIGMMMIFDVFSCTLTESLMCLFLLFKEWEFRSK